MKIIFLFIILGFIVLGFIASAIKGEKKSPIKEDIKMLTECIKALE